ncbi:hypothetical protein [Rubritalea sp.]
MKSSLILFAVAAMFGATAHAEEAPAKKECSKKECSKEECSSKKD